MVSPLKTGVISQQEGTSALQAPPCQAVCPPSLTLMQAARLQGKTGAAQSAPSGRQTVTVQRSPMVSTLYTAYLSTRRSNCVYKLQGGTGSFSARCWGSCEQGAKATEQAERKEGLSEPAEVVTAAPLSHLVTRADAAAVASMRCASDRASQALCLVTSRTTWGTAPSVDRLPLPPEVDQRLTW